MAGQRTPNFNCCQSLEASKEETVQRRSYNTISFKYPYNLQHIAHCTFVDIFVYKRIVCSRSRHDNELSCIILIPDTHKIHCTSLVKSKRHGFEQQRKQGVGIFIFAGVLLFQLRQARVRKSAKKSGF